VIMVSGNTDPALAREALELGALAYVDKPFDFAYLKRVIAMALGEGVSQWRSNCLKRRESLCWKPLRALRWALTHPCANVWGPGRCCARRYSLANSVSRRRRSARS
jgi:DNA-binding response OmpR family regulator